MESTNPSWANLQAGRPEQCTTAGERPDRATYTTRLLPSLSPSFPPFDWVHTQTHLGTHRPGQHLRMHCCPLQMGNTWAQRHLPHCVRACERRCLKEAGKSTMGSRWISFIYSTATWMRSRSDWKTLTSIASAPFLHKLNNKSCIKLCFIC